VQCEALLHEVQRPRPTPEVGEATPPRPCGSMTRAPVSAPPLEWLRRGLLAVQKSVSAVQGYSTFIHGCNDGLAHDTVVCVVHPRHPLRVPHEGLPLAHSGPSLLQLTLHGAPQSVCRNVRQFGTVEHSTRKPLPVVRVGLRSARRGEQVLESTPLLCGRQATLQGSPGTLSDRQGAVGQVRLQRRVPHPTLAPRPDQLPRHRHSACCEVHVLASKGCRLPDPQPLMPHHAHEISHMRLLHVQSPVQTLAYPSPYHTCTETQKSPPPGRNG